jgi:hypothetical protein
VLVCPFVLGDGEKLPLQVKSVTPPWLILSVYVVNSTSATITIQLLFGQPASFAVTVGVAVDTLTLARPFLMFVIVCEPAAVTSTAGFWPGDWFEPEGVVQVRPVAVPLAVRSATTVSLPRPATSAVQLSCVPTSVPSPQENSRSCLSARLHRCPRSSSWSDQAERRLGASASIRSPPSLRPSRSNSRSNWSSTTGSPSARSGLI